MSDEDDWQYEHSIFVSADGINLSAPWRLAKHGLEGVLTDEQITAIADRFDVDRTRMHRISKQVGFVLDPEAFPNLISIRRSIAAERAAREIDRARGDLAAGTKRLAAALKRMSRLYVGSYETSAEAEQFRAALRGLQGLVGSAKRSCEDLANVAAAPNVAVQTRATDRRVIPDRRRTLVLQTIFLDWHGAGRPLTCTTDPVTSRRSGPLIDFVNAVVACVTEPSSALSPETIYKEMRAFAPPRYGPDFNPLRRDHG